MLKRLIANTFEELIELILWVGLIVAAIVGFQAYGAGANIVMKIISAAAFLVVAALLEALVFGTLVVLLDIRAYLRDFVQRQPD